MVLVDILVFLLVLGLLVFFHELGHFLAAKACGIYVDRFSLGMPPRLFGVRWGDTDYCIGALPFGGYVKMAGQEDAPLSEEEREATYGMVPPEKWFNKKPVWQRFIVILAGPAMNLVLAVLLYGIVAAVGAEVPETEVDTRIGPVVADSPAANAPMFRVPADGTPVDLSGAPDAVGWQTGDRVITINGNRIRSIMDVAIDAVLGSGETLAVVLERPGQDDGAATRYVSPVTPTMIRDTDRHARFGVGPFETVLIGEISDGSPAQQAGIQNGDIVLRANGKIVDSTTFVETTEQTPEGQTLNLDIQRGDQCITTIVTPTTVGRFQEVVIGAANDAESGPPIVLSLTDDYPKDGKLLPRDVIEQINGQPATMALLRDIERTTLGGTVTLEVRRPGVLFGLLRDEHKLTVTLPAAPVRAIGVRLDTKYVYSRVPAAQVVPEAFRLTYQAFARTIKTVVMLVRGSVSPKDLGGPVMIYQVTTTAARAGFWWLFSITAFISVNLCVFNLLPLPVLDGGLLVYFAVEGIRGKPLSPKVQERMQQVGLLLILGLFLFITFNDIQRWVVSVLGGA